MKPTLKLFAAAILALALAAPAQALVITPTSMPQWTGTQTSVPLIEAVIFPIMNAVGPVTELYKATPGASDAQSLAGSYNTIFNGAADSGTIT